MHTQFLGLPDKIIRKLKIKENMLIMIFIENIEQSDCHVRAYASFYHSLYRVARC